MVLIDKSDARIAKEVEVVPLGVHRGCKAHLDTLGLPFLYGREAEGAVDIPLRFGQILGGGFELPFRNANGKRDERYRVFRSTQPPITICIEIDGSTSSIRQEVCGNSLR